MPPSRRVVRRLRWAFWPTAVLVAVGITGQATYAAFTDKATNSGNSFTVGTVVLTDDDSGTALFSLTGLKPGSSGSRCIAVTSSGNLPSSVKLYAVDAATTRSLSTYITLTVVQGTGGGSGSCTGFTPLSSGSAVYSNTLATFVSTATGYGSGVGVWNPTGAASETRSYQFSYLVSTSTPDTSQGGTASLGLTWEAQNT